MATTIDKAFLCPITGDVMTDPVLMVESGQTYERSAILGWIRTCQQKGDPIADPINRVPLITCKLVENYAIRSQISNAGFPVTKPSAPIAPKAFTNKADISRVYLKYNNTVIERQEVTNDSTLPLTLIAVIDISGSMQNPSSEQEGSSFYSRLTLVKLVLKVLVHMCDDDTKLGLVVFSDEANLIFSPKLMTQANKKEACQRIDTLRPTNGTQISKGLELAFKMASEETDTSRNVCAMVLTDGEPTESIDQIKLTLTKRPEYLTLYTVAFGFGNGLNSNLMYEMAMHTGGNYAYIPDASCPEMGLCV